MKLKTKIEEINCLISGAHLKHLDELQRLSKDELKEQFINSQCYGKYIEGLSKGMELVEDLWKEYIRKEENTKEVLEELNKDFRERVG
jgi:hypothetical protein